MCSSDLVVVTQASGSTAQVAIGTVTDHGDGSYTVPLGPSTTAGSAKLRIVVNDGLGPVQIGPMPELLVTNDGLWLSTAGIDVNAGGSFDAVLNAGPAHAGQPSILLASACGSTPGVALAPGLTLPLYADYLTYLMVDWAASGAVPNLYGDLDAQGRRRIPLSLPPAALQFLRGGNLHFAWLTLLPVDYASNGATLQLR